jgi:hypothetical protein
MGGFISAIVIPARILDTLRYRAGFENVCLPPFQVRWHFLPDRLEPGREDSMPSVQEALHFTPDGDHLSR